MNIFETAKSVSMQSIAERYGFKVNKNGQISCPFHSDSHPSMKVYPGKRGWYCFVCNQGGDVVSFVSKLFSLSRLEAAKKICSDFGLCEYESKSYKSEYRKKQRERNERLKEWELNVAKSFYLNRAVKVVPRNDEEAAVYGKYVAELEYLDYWFENTPLKGEL